MIKIILAIAINISDKRSKSIDWFLYDNGLRLERVKEILLVICKF